MIKTASNILRSPPFRLSVVLAGAAATLLSVWITNDQRRWQQHDTGGTPPTWAGYWRMTKLRIARFLGGHNLTSHYSLRREGQRYLRESIEPRQWPRPKTREWTLPQRQETVILDPTVHARIFDWTEKFVEENPDLLEFGASKTEGYSAPAVYAKTGLATRNPDAQNPVIGDEIFHAHPEDSSLHVWLTEADLKTVVSRGWGEQFPLTEFGLTPPGWGFVYTPRTMAECDIVEEIIRAGIEHVTGQKPV